MPVAGLAIGAMFLSKLSAPIVIVILGALLMVRVTAGRVMVTQWPGRATQKVRARLPMSCDAPRR